MASIFTGLSAGKTGLQTHGIAMAVIGDNIANVSTIGYKESRAEFADLVAGGQTPRITVGSGSAISATTAVFKQGTLEFTGRNLDLAIDGNGYFAVADGAERFYTRAGNFKVSEDGDLVNQDGFSLLGFPTGGSGALESINVTTVSQSNVNTSTVTIAGNLDASTATVDLTSIPAVTAAGASGATSTTTYAQLSALAAFSTSVDVFDSLGGTHTITFFFFHSDNAANEWQVRGYVNSEDVDISGSATGLPRLVTDSTLVVGTGALDLTFDTDGTRNNVPAGNVDLAASIAWNNGATTGAINLLFDPFTQFATNSNIQSITQDGQGVGNVTSISIDQDGGIFALLDNGQRSRVGTLALVNFANPEALTRLGSTLLQESTSSGEPIIGTPLAGTFGAVEAGSIELSTVDIADQFVKLITLQRGFQANSRIIQTINGLLDNVIQLA